MARKKAKPGTPRDEQNVVPAEQPEKGGQGEPAAQIDTGQASKPEPKGKKKKPEIDEAALIEAREQVRIMTSMVEEIRAQIEAERAQNISSPAVIEAEIDCARLNWESAQAALNQVKGLSRRRKDEIDEWKAWYENLPAAEKEAGLARLQNEIKWRADELTANADRLNGKLIQQELETRGVLEMAQLKLEAFREGYHKRPIHEDPRLAGAQAELKQREAAVASLEHGKPKKK